jgi:hypothetical protein
LGASFTGRALFLASFRKNSCGMTGLRSVHEVPVGKVRSSGESRFSAPRIEVAEMDEMA